VAGEGLKLPRLTFDLPACTFSNPSSKLQDVPGGR
jgi:hypothetical protein